jgi:hypothetical protein
MGKVHGGQQPISGATIQLFAASTAGNGFVATPLLTRIVKTDTSGAFSITGAYTCPDASSLVYLVATGGNPGLAPGSNNAAAALMAALGPCRNLSASTFIFVNEVTTVASVSALAPFMTSYSAVGSTSVDVQQLAAAFTQVNALVDSSTGTMPGPGLEAGYSSPNLEINSLADILASCINSSGGEANDGSVCGELFAYTQPVPLPAPTETIGAALQIAKSPTTNVAALFGLSSATAPFQPALAAVPSDWAVAIQPGTPIGLPQRTNLLGEYLLNEGSGPIAHDTSGLGNDGTISGATWEGKSDLDFAVAGDFVQAPVALNQANTWQFAIYSPPFGRFTYPLAPGYGERSEFGFNPSILCGTDIQHTCFISTSYFGPVSHRFFAFQSSGTEASEPLSAGWHVVTLVGGQGGQLDHYYFDGVEVSSYAHQGSGLFLHPSSGNYQIGGSGIYTGNWFVGKIAAVWAWSTSLSQSDAQSAAQSAMGFIRSKGAAPVYVPQIRSAPVVVGGIDSRSVNNRATTHVWIDNLTLSDPTYTTQDLAFPGSTAYDHLAMFDELEGSQIAGNTAPTIAVIWGGVNDFATSMTARTIANSLKGLVLKAKAVGARVILATEISSTSGTNGDASKNALNTIIRSEAIGWGADSIADLSTIPQLGADGAHTSTLYFADGTHPTDAGEAYITAVMSNAVNELIGSSDTNHHTTNAATYQELAGDRYLDITGAAMQTVTLPSCIGYSLSRQISNLGNSTATIATMGGQTLRGSGTVSAGSAAVVTPVPGPLSTGGCNWQQTN